MVRKKKEPTPSTFEFQIEKGVSMPEKRSPKGRKVIKWPFGQMEINDSVLIPSEVAPLARIISAYEAVQRRSVKEVNFSYREVEGGVRVWRTK